MPGMRWVALVVVLAGSDVVFRLDRVPELDAPPAAVGRWLEVVAGHGHTCALDDTRHLWCWGRNFSGELGIASNETELDVGRQITEATWTVVATNDVTTCGIQGDGSLWCWGANGAGQVGTGTSGGVVRAPTLIDAGPWLDVSTGWDHTCAVRGDHTLWCWGLNDRGQLGDGTLMAKPARAPIGADASWDEVSAGGNSTCAIASDRTLWCWGANGAGQLAISTQTSTMELAPRQLSTDAWEQIDVSQSFACGINAVRQLRCWGANGVGQLGDGTTTSRGSPAPVLVDGEDRTDWLQIATGDDHACARSAAAAASRRATRSRAGAAT